jgi:hypothetical protein
MTPSCELQAALSVRTQTPTRCARSLSLSLAVPYSLPCSLERKTLTLEFKTGSAGELKHGTVASDRRTHEQSELMYKIRQCQLAPLCSLQPLQRAVAVQLPSRPKIPHSSINVNNIKWELTLIWY